jgi:hypothetical protein
MPNARLVPGGTPSTTPGDGCALEKLHCSSSPTVRSSRAEPLGGRAALGGLTALHVLRHREVEAVLLGHLDGLLEVVVMVVSCRELDDLVGRAPLGEGRWGSVFAGVQFALPILNFLLICRSEDVNRRTGGAGWPISSSSGNPRACDDGLRSDQPCQTLDLCPAGRRARHPGTGVLPRNCIAPALQPSNRHERSRWCGRAALVELTPPTRPSASGSAGRASRPPRRSSRGHSNGRIVRRAR